MTTQKTLASSASVAAYIGAIEIAARRADCEALCAVMQRVTSAEPVMWGASIVGFGQYHYRYASGHEGDAPLVGFSSRKAAIVVYLACEFAARDKLLAELGKHSIGKACLYIKQLADIKLPVLEQLIAASNAHLRQLYPLQS